MTDFYKAKNILLISQPSETARAMMFALQECGATVHQVQVLNENALSSFDVSANAKLTQSLAKADQNRNSIRKFVTGWFTAHRIPDIVIYCVSQSSIRRDPRPEGAPLRHFVASTTLFEYLLPVLSTRKNARLAVCVGLDSHDFFGPQAERIGFRALESYLKTWDKSFQAAGVTGSYVEFLEPGEVVDGHWPKSALTGFLRSLHPYTHTEVAKNVLEEAATARLGQKPLRTEALFWLGKFHRRSAAEPDSSPLVYATPARPLAAAATGS